MTDKFDEFMSKNTPLPSGGLKTLVLPPRKNWLAGIALSGALAASLVLVTVSRQNFSGFDDDMEISVADEFPTEYQDVENILEDI